MNEKIEKLVGNPLKVREPIFAEFKDLHGRSKRAAPSVHSRLANRKRISRTVANIVATERLQG